MPHDTHIVRFKVGQVSCRAMPDQQQYTIYYRRGDTSRSTPCFVAQNGVIDFSTMPEGAAIIHFKTGHGGRRFAPKYIQLRIEEYTRGMPRRVVGEAEVDCSEVLIQHRGIGSVTMANSGVGLLTCNFTMYGQPAKLEMAVLVYPENGVALSFDNVPNWNSAHSSNNIEGKKDHNASSSGSGSSEVKGELKVLTRGEAMTLLISLETLLERRRNSKSNTSDGSKSSVAEPQTKLEKRIAELEERRKALTGSEGLASQVVKTRCDDVIAAQFTALAHHCRNNYIGQTAAFFRQMALTSGVHMNPNANNDEYEEKHKHNNRKESDNDNDDDDDDKEEIDNDENDAMNDDKYKKNTMASKNMKLLQEQLAHANKRIEEINNKLRDLDQEQLALGNLQDKVDVTQEVCANLEKISTLQSQRGMLEKSRNSITTALHEAEQKVKENNSNTINKNKTSLAAVFGDSDVNADGANVSSAERALRKEVKLINDEIKLAASEQKELRSKMKHMTTVAAGHVLAWARSKNPPVPSVTESSKNAVDDLFADLHTNKGESHDDEDDNDYGNKRKKNNLLDEEQRKQVLTAFQGLTSVNATEKGKNNANKGKKKISATSSSSFSSSTSSSRSSSSSSSSESGRKQKKNNLFGATDLPSMGDFAASKTKTDRTTSSSPAAGQSSNTTKATYRDPNAPEGLGIGMFANNDASNKSGSGFDFSNTIAPMPATSPAFELAPIGTNDNFGLFGNSNNAGTGAGMSISTSSASSPSPYAKFSFTNPSDTHSSTLPMTTSSGLAETNTVTTTTTTAAAKSHKDDPFYDEMDDFTVPEGADAPGAVIEFTGDFGNFGLDSSAANDTSLSNNNNNRVGGGGGGADWPGSTNPRNMFEDANATSSSNAVPSRPKFDFGPGDEFPVSNSISRPTVDFDNPVSFDFGNNTSNLNANEGGISSSSNKNNKSNDPFGWNSGLPTYNFES